MSPYSRSLVCTETSRTTGRRSPDAVDADVADPREVEEVVDLLPLVESLELVRVSLPVVVLAVPVVPADVVGDVGVAARCGSAAKGSSTLPPRSGSRDWIVRVAA
jgi:hypothetical protein